VDVEYLHLRSEEYDRVSDRECKRGCVDVFVNVESVRGRLQVDLQGLQARRVSIEAERGDVRGVGWYERGIEGVNKEEVEKYKE